MGRRIESWDSNPAYTHDIVFRVTRRGQKEGWSELLGVFQSEAYARETVNAFIEWQGGELE